MITTDWQTRTTPRWRVVAVALLAGLLLAAHGLGAPTAEAAARVTVTPTGGGSTLAPDRPSQIRVQGSGFQVVPGGFGGIYVFFGWVDDASGGGWRPSRGGVTGRDYLYVPDSEERDNQGYQRFVTFPGSETSSAANGGELGADGSWSFTMNVPGARFQAVDRAGTTRTIDCTEVTCGIITIGAHGVTNANNETFTPVRFAAAGGDGDGAGQGAGTGQPSGGGPGGTPGAGSEGSDDDGAASGDDGEASDDDGAASGDDGEADEEDEAPRVPATVGVDQATAMVGRVLTFVGQGFKPGEQVVATLDNGVAAVGPLLAGPDGEVAGVLQLPQGTTVGTHVLRLSGAGSGEAPEVEFTVRADPVAVAAAEAAAAGGGEPPATWAYVVAGVAALAFAWLVLSSLVAAWRRRRAARRGGRVGAGLEARS